MQIVFLFIGFSVSELKEYCILFVNLNKSINSSLPLLAFDAHEPSHVLGKQLLEDEAVSLLVLLQLS